MIKNVRKHLKNQSKFKQEVLQRIYFPLKVPHCITSFLTLALDGSVWSTSRPSHFAGGTDPSTNWTGNSVGPRPCLDILKNSKLSCPYQKQKLNHPAYPTSVNSTHINKQPVDLHEYVRGHKITNFCAVPACCVVNGTQQYSTKSHKTTAFLTYLCITFCCTDFQPLKAYKTCTQTSEPPSF